MYPMQIVAGQFFFLQPYPEPTLFGTFLPGTHLSNPSSLPEKNLPANLSGGIFPEKFILILQNLLWNCVRNLSGTCHKPKTHPRTKALDWPLAPIAFRGRSENTRNPQTFSIDTMLFTQSSFKVRFFIIYILVNRLPWLFFPGYLSIKLGLALCSVES